MCRLQTAVEEEIELNLTDFVPIVADHLAMLAAPNVSSSKMKLVIGTDGLDVRAVACGSQFDVSGGQRIQCLSQMAPSCITRQNGVNDLFDSVFYYHPPRQRVSSIEARLTINDR